MSILPDTIPIAGIDDSFIDQNFFKNRQGVTLEVRLLLRIAAVAGVIIGIGVGLQPHHVSMHQGGTLAASAMSDGLSKTGKAVEHVDTVQLAHKEAWKIREGAGDAPARGLDLCWHRDGVPVVLDNEEHRKLVQGGGTDRLVQFPLAGSSISSGDVDQLILTAGGQGGIRRQAPDKFFHLGSADGLQELGACRTRLADDVQLRRGKMIRHLAASRTGIRPLAEGLAKKVRGAHSKAVDKGAIAIIGIEPVLAGPEQLRGHHLDGLVPRAAELELESALAPETDLRLVHFARSDHEIVDPDEVFLLHGSYGMGAGFALHPVSLLLDASPSPGLTPSHRRLCRSDA